MDNVVMTADLQRHLHVDVDPDFFLVVDGSLCLREAGELGVEDLVTDQDKAALPVEQGDGGFDEPYSSDMWLTASTTHFAFLRSHQESASQS
jgi:hypothetical protein